MPQTVPSSRSNTITHRGKAPLLGATSTVVRINDSPGEVISALVLDLWQGGGSRYIRVGCRLESFVPVGSRHLLRLIHLCSDQLLEVTNALDLASLKLGAVVLPGELNGLLDSVGLLHLPDEGTHLAGELLAVGKLVRKLRERWETSKGYRYGRLTYLILTVRFESVWFGGYW